MKDELQLIQELMQELQDKMQYGKDDLEDRLGRNKKPDLEVMKIEGDMMPEDKEDPLMEEDQMVDSMDEMPMEEESPEEKLKRRVMKLRG